MAAFITVSLTLSLVCATMWGLTQNRFWAWLGGMISIVTLVAVLGGVV